MYFEFIDNASLKFTELAVKAKRSSKRLWEVQREIENATVDLELLLKEAADSISAANSNEAATKKLVAKSEEAFASFLEWRNLYNRLEQEAVHTKRNSQAYEEWFEGYLPNQAVPADHDWKLLETHTEAELENYRPNLNAGTSVAGLIQTAAIESTKKLQELRDKRDSETERRREERESLRDRVIAIAALLLGAIGLLDLFPDDSFWTYSQNEWRNIKVIFGIVIFSASMLLTLFALLSRKNKQ